MRKIKEVLRLRFALGLHQDQIARSCSIGQATVHRYLERATAVGLSWPLAEDCDDRQLNELLFPARPQLPSPTIRPAIHFTMKAEDYYIQKRRGWVRLHEKGGKVNELPLPPQPRAIFG